MPKKILRLNNIFKVRVLYSIDAARKKSEKSIFPKDMQMFTKHLLSVYYGQVGILDRVKVLPRGFYAH